MNQTRDPGAAPAAVRTPPAVASALRTGRVRYFDPMTGVAPQGALAQAAQTMTVIAATGTPVRRYSWDMGVYDEVLAITAEAVDLTRVTAGACPFLADHARWNVFTDHMGIIEDARIVPDPAAPATSVLEFDVRFDSGPLAQDLARRFLIDRTLRTVSVGYDVLDAQVTFVDPDGVPTVTITRWQPTELSGVSVPADHGAVQVRGAARTDHPNGAPLGVSPMTNRSALLAGAAAVRTPQPPASQTNPATAPTPGAIRSALEQHRGHPGAGGATRDAAPAATSPAQTRNDPAAPAADASGSDPAPADPVMPTTATVDNATVSAGADGAISVQMALTLRSQATGLGIPAAEVDQALARSGQTQAGFTAWAMARAAQAQQQRQGNTVPAGSAARAITDERDTRRAAIIEGLTARALRRAPTGDHAQAARAYRDARVVDIMAELMNTRALGTATVVLDNFRNAIRSGQHATSDFPIIMGAVANNVVAAAYERAQPSYRAWSAQRDFSNFMPHNFLRLSDLPRLRKLGENAEIQAGSVNEARETTQLETYALQLRFSRKMLVNDQLGMFVDALSSWADSVALQENELAYANLETARLTNGKLVFHADHGNLASPGAAPSDATLSAMRKAMRQQKGLAAPGEKARNLNIAPRYLVVGPEHETTAQKLLTAIQATATGDVNIWASTIELVTDAEIEDKRWYGFADPARAPTFIHGFLNGQAGPTVTEDEPFGVDGFAVQCIHDFAVGAIDSVGGFKSSTF